MAEPVGGRLSAAMRAVYQERGVSQVDIAEALQVDQPTVSRWARGMRRPPLDALPVIERLCGVPLGTILRRAGYVDDEQVDTRAAIAADPALSNDAVRAVVLDVYESAVRRLSARQTPSNADDSAHMASAR